MQLAKEVSGVIVNELAVVRVAEIAVPFPSVNIRSVKAHDAILADPPELIDITDADNSSGVSVFAAGLIAIPDIVKVPDSTEKMLLSGMNPVVELKRKVMSENKTFADPEREKVGL